MTLTIELDVKDMVPLTTEANKLGISVEVLAGRVLAHHAVMYGRTVSDEAFRTAMEASFKKNSELYRRLAKM